jgi:hypothetical protein
VIDGFRELKLSQGPVKPVTPGSCYPSLGPKSSTSLRANLVEPSDVFTNPIEAQPVVNTEPMVLRTANFFDGLCSAKRHIYDETAVTVLDEKLTMHLAEGDAQLSGSGHTLMESTRDHEPPLQLRMTLPASNLSCCHR